MNLRLYSARNYLGIITHYTAMAGVAAAAYSMGNPWIMGGIGAAATGFFAASLYGSKEVMETMLHRHPDNHMSSPRLGKMVRELYQRSGLKADNYPVYDFRAAAETIHDTPEEREGKKALNKQMRISRLMPNAAALNLGKPVIMISEPLLALLSDDEEKAVLAHEFAHAAAKHQHVNLPLKLVGTVTKLTNRVTLLMSAFGAGIWAFAGGVATVLGTAFAATILNKDSKLSTKKGQLSPLEKHKKEMLGRNVGATSVLAGLGYFSFFNPAFAPIFAGAVTIAKSLKVVEGGLSRSLEYQADKATVKLGASPLALVTALRKLDTLQKRSIEKMFNQRADEIKPDMIDSAWKRWTSTHPTSERRIGRLTDIAREQGYSASEIRAATHGPLDIPDGAHIPYETIQKIASRLLPDPY